MPKMKEKKTKKKKRGLYMTLHAMLAGFFRCVLRVHVTGAEKLPSEGGAIVCINHVAFWDVITVACVLRRQLRFLAKKELFKIPILAPLIRALGACPVDRSGADVGAIKRSIALAESGELVSVFPQGTRQGGRNPADTPIKNGAGMMICRARVPAVPVCIKMKKMKYSLFRRIDVIVGDPIPYESFGFESGGSAEYAAASERVFGEICRLGGFLPLPDGKSENGEDK